MRGCASAERVWFLVGKVVHAQLMKFDRDGEYWPSDNAIKFALHCRLVVVAMLQRVVKMVAVRSRIDVHFGEKLLMSREQCTESREQREESRAYRAESKAQGLTGRRCFFLWIVDMFIYFPLFLCIWGLPSFPFASLLFCCDVLG